MLKTLRISNYAIINEAEIEFSPVLNIITGETGAGKSILLGALSLLTGDRADSRVLFDPEKKCIVEGIFNIANYALQDFFSNENIDYITETIIRRELTASGKSRAFINDTPVTLTVLQQLADRLVTIHSQHETLALGNSRFQLTVIDAMADLQKNVSAFSEAYKTWKTISNQLEEAEAAAAKAMIEKDFIEYQFTELDAANLESINQKELENDLQQLNHTEEIKRNLLTSVDLLENSAGNIHDTMRSVIQQLQAVAGYATGLNNYIERLTSATIELKDITRDLNDKAEATMADPRRADEINQTLNILFKLQKKHHRNTVEALITLRNELNDTLFAFAGNEATIEKLKKEKEKKFSALCLDAEKISRKRQSVFSSLQKQVKVLLAEAGMKDAEFIVQHSFDIKSFLSETGADSILFLFSANKGSAPQDIKKVASGGELSRLMLCIKSLLAESTALPTLIFDEIDTGVSGAVAHKVGNILSRLAEKHQVIAITHLPQIASKGDHHLFVYKTSGKINTHTHIKLLSQEERLGEIANMLSGDSPTQSAIDNARELLSAD